MVLNCDGRKKQNCFLVRNKLRVCGSVKAIVFALVVTNTPLAGDWEMLMLAVLSGDQALRMKRDVIPEQSCGVSRAEAPAAHLTRD